MERTIPPALTVERLKPHLGRLGITRIADITGLDRIGLPVVTVVRPLGLALAVSQGKGLSDDAAVAAGLVESIEAWAAERCRDAQRSASHGELLSEAATAVLDTRRLPKRADRQFGMSTRLPWRQGIDLLAGERPIWLPLPLIHLAFTAPPQAGNAWFCASSNGLAGGNNREEALIHALCEVIERDALALWHTQPAARRAATRIDLSGVACPELSTILAMLAAADMDVALFDATSDVGVPVVHAEIAERERSLPPFFPVAVSGDGCALTPASAARRALLEAVQSRLTFIAGTRDDLDSATYAQIGQTACRANLGNAVRRLDDLPICPAADQRAQRDWLLARLRAIGIAQAAVVDLAPPDGVPLNVVRVVVPGLETKHSHPAYRPGPRALAASLKGWRVAAA